MSIVDVVSGAAIKPSGGDPDSSHRHIRAFGQVDFAGALGLIRSGVEAIVLLIIGEFIIAGICAVLAKIKGYSAILFGVLGFFFSLIIVIIVLVIPNRRRR